MTSDRVEENDGEPAGRARYVVVTPARDEERTLPLTIASMRAQTVRPVSWVIVDDGSTDRTGTLADEAAAQELWITVLHLPDRGARRMGYGTTFQAGFERVQSNRWEFLTKLDADVSFAPDYFEQLLGRFADDPRLGVAGGGIHEEVDGKLRFMPHPLFHVRGAVKTYRRACLDEIGGLPFGVAFDTLDEAKANQLGWSTRTFVELPVHHLRPTGGAVGTWSNAVKNGRVAYCAGYHPLFQLVRAGKVLGSTRSPKAGAGLVWGYVRAWAGDDEPPERELRRYVRRQQLRRLTGRDSVWR